MADRVRLFIDAQNAYRGARECFATDRARHTEGQFDPLRLGELIAGRGPAGSDRVLQQVRVYTGRPDASRQPRAYAAHMRQCAAWTRAGVVVIPRPLRYPPGWPDQRASEKGIDVQLSIDLVAAAIDGDYDIGVIVSTDTDLRPTIEFVSRRFIPLPRVETAAWRGLRASRALRLESPRRTWVHYLDSTDYEAVHDSRDYNIP